MTVRIEPKRIDFPLHRVEVRTTYGQASGYAHTNRGAIRLARKLAKRLQVLSEL